jgi:hypothetical protein
MDLHGAALQAARRTSGQVMLVRGDAVQLPFASRGFDCVVCAEVLEHLPDDLLQGAAAELGRVADGTVLVTVPNRERLRRRHLSCPECGEDFHLYGHAQHFTPDRLRSLIPGFSMMSVDGVGPRRNEWLGAVDGPWRRQRLSREFVVCPSCGWDGMGEAAGVNPGRAGQGAADDLILRSVGRLGARRWLLASYRREDDEVTR